MYINVWIRECVDACVCLSMCICDSMRASVHACVCIETRAYLDSKCSHGGSVLVHYHPVHVKHADYGL